MQYIIGLMLTCVLVIGAVLGGCAPNYSVGERVGVVNKVSRKGLFVKDYTAQVNLGGMRAVSTEAGDAFVANVWNVSTTDATIAKQLQEVANSGATVKVEYREWFLPPARLTHTHEALSVTVLRE